MQQKSFKDNFFFSKKTNLSLLHNTLINKSLTNLLINKCNRENIKFSYGILFCSSFKIDMYYNLTLILSPLLNKFVKKNKTNIAYHSTWKWRENKPIKNNKCSKSTNSKFYHDK